MPMVIPAELPAPDIVIVVPDEGRVLLFVDPRVPCAVAADTVVRVKGALRRSGDRRFNLAWALELTPYVLSAA